MQYIGKFDKKILNVIIKPTYRRYKIVNYDLSVAKSIILNFIYKMHITTTYDNTDVNHYKLNTCPIGLKFTMKHNDDVSYYICIKTGSLFVY